MRWAKSGLGMALVTLCLSGLAAAPAAASPIWDARTLWGDTNLKPGSTGMFKVEVLNLGESASSGPVTATVALPPGVTRIAPKALDEARKLNERWNASWTCSGSSTVTCVHADTIGARGPEVAESNPESGFAPWILFRVQVAPSAAEGTFPLTTTISGGGGNSLERERQITISARPAGFGIVPGSFLTESYDAEYPFGVPERQAGSHPFELRVALDLNQVKRENQSDSPLASPPTWLEPEGLAKTVETTLPLGLIGNPEALPKCRPEQFLGFGAGASTTACPPSTQVGVIDLNVRNGESSGGYSFVAGALSRIPVYNLEPPQGVPADFGFQVAGSVQAHIYPSLDASSGYAIKATVPFITTLTPVRETRFTMWGVPADPSHDHLRAKQFPGEAPIFGSSSSGPIKPLLTMPMDCDNADLHMSAALESWQQPGRFVSERLPGFQMQGCDDERFRFKPQVSLKPTSRVAGGPTGLEVNLEVPQRNDTVVNAEELYAENGDISSIPTPPMKKVEVTLPEGMTLSTSAAQGLASCSPEQIGIGTNDPVTCPDASQYGSLTIETPILPPGEPMVGQVFIAEQNRNPFNDFLALYLVIQDRERGLLVKLPGRIQLDERSGQIKTTFDNLPQFPVSNMQMTLKGGVRAGLVNPATCGEKTITATFVPWHDKEEVITRTSSYEIAHKADGSPCVNDLRDRPFAPQVVAGTTSNSAGAYSPFVFRLTRTDDDQEIASLATKLPKGLLAKVAGISQCPEASIAASGAKTGKEELMSPSCPQSSYLGSADVGSGVGQVLTFVSGKAYLAGPYKGAPLSMVVITPVVAGPYDLGTIAVRSALDVDRTTAQVEVATDPFPQIFKGIPVRIRDIRIKVDRPESTLNPTNCDPMAIEARLGGVGGDLFSTHDDVFVGLSERFQASNCAALGFKPSIAFQLKGGTRRGQFPALTAKLKARPGDANIRKARVTLPRTAFLAQEHIRTICTRVQFAAKACPAGSVIGHAKATSPLIDGALEGPVVMRSSSNKLPDLVATLNGIIEVNVASRIDSFKRRIRSTFDLLPDVPVSSFELRMQGGRKGLIVNSADLCRTTSRALIELDGQNGAVHDFKPKVKAVACKGKNRKGKKQRKPTNNSGGKSR